MTRSNDSPSAARPLSRRDFLERSASSLAAAALSPALAGWATPSHPNVLMIAIDDLRDWIGVAKTHPQVRTPNIDRLASRGVCFNNAHCAAPACCPSRSALLSGLSPARTGIYENGQITSTALAPYRLLTQHFMDQGYYVAGAGKIYHGANRDPLWHSYWQKPERPAANNPANPSVMGTPLDEADADTLDGQRLQYILDRLAERPPAPVFLACGFVRPHTPWDVPRPYFDLFPPETLARPPVLENDLDDVPPIGRKIALGHCEQGHKLKHPFILEQNNWERNLQAYLASIAFVDAQVGKLLDAWEAGPYAKNGIIVLWGDHGWHLGEKSHWSKFTMWETATRVPLIIQAPGWSTPGAVCQQPVSLLDLYPTLLQLCDLPLPHRLDGQTLGPLLKKPDLTWQRGVTSYHGFGNAAVRSRHYRYIHYRDQTKELYDHRSDPNEWHNLAGDPAQQETINWHHQWIFHPFANPCPFTGKRKSFMDEECP